MHRIKKAFLANGDFILPCVRRSVLFSILGAAFLVMVKLICSFILSWNCELLQRLWNWPSNYSELINVFCTTAEVCLFFSLCSLIYIWLKINIYDQFFWLEKLLLSDLLVDAMKYLNRFKIIETTRKFFLIW